MSGKSAAMHMTDGVWRGSEASVAVSPLCANNKGCSSVVLRVQCLAGGRLGKPRCRGTQFAGMMSLESLSIDGPNGALI